MLPALLLWMLTAATAGADSLSSALDARARLGPAVWSRVLRIENDRPGRPYPARLFSYYFGAGSDLRGHTVLLFRERGRHWIYDSYQDAHPRPLAHLRGATPLAVAAEVMPPGGSRRPDKAVYLPLEPGPARQLPHRDHG